MSKFREYVDEHLPRSVTQRQLAESAKVTEQQLSRDLRVGLENAQIGRVQRYVSALGCQFEDIVSTKED